MHSSMGNNIIFILFCQVLEATKNLIFQYKNCLLLRIPLVYLLLSGISHLFFVLKNSVFDLV